MMRQNFKNKDYFEEFIKACNDRTRNFYTGLAEGRVAAGREKMIHYKIFRLSFHSTIAKYTAGFGLELVSTQFNDCIDKLKAGWVDDGNSPADKFFFDDYHGVVTLLSLAGLMKSDESKQAILKQLFEKYSQKDFLVDFILSNGQANSQLPLMYPDIYGDLRMAIESPEKADAAILNFLNKKWYNGMNMVYWFNNHKSKHDTHFGYWAFEVAEVVRLLGLDPEKFKQSQFFPIDLLR